MPVCARPSRLLRLAAALALALGAGAVWAAPARVVSINLCTDQLAMLLAAPGQLVSVSFLARDPHMSAMVTEAAAYPANHAQAEEVFLMHPDLVLAGEWSAPATVDLLRRLGIPVVQLPAAARLDQVPELLRAAGRALGREAEAERLARGYEADLAALRRAPGPVLAAFYGPNGYTSGRDTLSGDILAAAGLRNLATEEGISGGAALPLERLVMAAPDLLITAAPYPGASRSEELLAHPALADLRARAARAEAPDSDWVCGTPATLAAVAAMARAGAETGG